MKISVIAICILSILLACKDTTSAKSVDTAVVPHVAAVDGKEGSTSEIKEEPKEEEGTVSKESAPTADEIVSKTEPTVADSETPSSTKPAITKPKSKPSDKPSPVTSPSKPVVKEEKTNVEPEPKKSTNTTSVPTGNKVEEKPKSKPAKPAPPVKAEGSPDHTAFDALLSSHVSASGQVDYKALKGKTLKLDAYLADLQANTPQTSWSEDEELAYWINVYNAYTIKLILKNYPVKSITDLHGGKPWDVKWIEIAGKTYSLNNVENDIIRPKFNEPRIHFAVNCAAKSCPPLANQAFTAKNLESLLEKQTKAFVNNSKHNQLTKNSITVSKIFDWYGVDFGNVATFISRYASTEVSPAAKVSFSEYDWALNGM